MLFMHIQTMVCYMFGNISHSARERERERERCTEKQSAGYDCIADPSLWSQGR